MDRLESDRMFVAVMETGSFTAAARRLGTSSGQASKLLSRLEGELGVRLLNRTTRAVSPTEAGQAYFDGLRPCWTSSTIWTRRCATPRMRRAGGCG